MTTRITTETRQILVGENLTPRGEVQFDVADRGDLRYRCSNIPVVELLEALAKIPGVTATYKEPDLTFADLKPGTVFRYLNNRGEEVPAAPKYVKLADGGIINSGTWFRDTAQRDRASRRVQVVEP